MRKRTLSVSALCLAAAPLLTAFFLLLFYQSHSFYPFGNGTVSWCDMNQQVVPLLLHFKDILSGHGSALYSFQHAGGMNFWGVLFFFLSSPFSVLTLFVSKSNMLLFMNILVLLKLSTCAVTATLYFLRSPQRSLRPEYALLFGLLYAFSGYGLFFYQNIIWLDVMYLFPLLLLALERLFHEQRTLPYTLAVSALMVVNYYIGYMIVLFVLLYAGLLLSTSSGARRKKLAFLFLRASFTAALLTAVVWLPCFLQYLSSGRDISFAASLQSSEFLAPIETTVPLLFPSACTLVIMLYGMLHRPVMPGTQRAYLLLFLLLLIPIFVEPINKMWHTGNYQAFPVRYGFMLVFMQMAVAAPFLPSGSPPVLPRAALARRRFLIKATSYPLIILLLILAYSLFTSSYVKTHLDTLSHYTSTLWGDMKSLEGLFLLFLLSFLLYFLAFRGLHRRLYSSKIFVLICTLLVFVDAVSHTSVYMFSGDYPGHNDAYRQITELAAFQAPEEETGDFYRVKLREKYFDVNMLGGLGFPSLSHYTSLTAQDYMFAMKQLGYSSYWMEVGGYGGTLLTDALLSVAYEVQARASVYSARSAYDGETYRLAPTFAHLGLGLLTPEPLANTNDLAALSRLEVQQLLFRRLFPQAASPFTAYEPSRLQSCKLLADAADQTRLSLTNRNTTGHMYYEIEVQQAQALYFDCFHQLSNRLSEPINGSFNIYVNGLPVETAYPSRSQNGLLYLGTFENETVIIDVQLLQDVTCRSFGLFGLQIESLAGTLANALVLNLQATGRRVSGTVTNTQPQTQYAFLSIPYDTGWKLRIDGKTAPLSQSFLGFSSFALPAGTHEVQLVYTPPGLYAGLWLTLAGLWCLIFSLLPTRMHRRPKRQVTSAPALSRFAPLLVSCLFWLTLGLLYFMPLLLNLWGHLW